MNKKVIVASLITIVVTLTLSTVNAEQRKGPRGGKPPAEAIELVQVQVKQKVVALMD